MSLQYNHFNNVNLTILGLFPSYIVVFVPMTLSQCEGQSKYFILLPNSTISEATLRRLQM